MGLGSETETNQKETVQIWNTLMWYGNNFNYGMHSSIYKCVLQPCVAMKNKRKRKSGLTQEQKE
jgi:hypothetical protein